MLLKYVIQAWLITVGVVGSTVAAANDLKPADFAHGADITPSDNGAWQTLVLPESYYRHSLRRGGGDVRVFNGDAQITPHKIEQPVTEQQQQRQFPLAFFPLYAPVFGQLDNLSLQVERSEDGALINIESQQQSETGEQQIVGYIIDAGHANEAAGDARLHRLSFAWSEPEYGFIHNLRLAGSGDLDHWLTLLEHQSLSRLEYAGESLGKDHITLNTASAARYLRLSWPPTEPSLQLTAVTADYAWRGQSQAIDLQFLELPLTRIQNPAAAIENNAWQINTDGQFPLTQLTFLLNDDAGNAYYAGSLYSRPDDDSRWQARGRFEQFRLQTVDGVVTSEPHDMAGVRDAHWLLRFDYPQQLAQDTAPAVRLGWRPKRLVFIAQGQGPYTLAFGHPGVGQPPAAAILDDLPDAAERAGHASLGDAYPVRSRPFEPAASSSPDWQKVLLWAVLIAGVALMLWMALRLYRQMQQE